RTSRAVVLRASSFETRPSGAPQDEGLPNTCGARGRIALSGGGLRPPGPVGGLHFGSWRERAGPMDAAPRSQERPALPGFLLRPRTRSLAGPSSVTLDGRTRKGPVGNGRMPMQIMRMLLIALGLVGVCGDPTWSQPSADYPNRQVNLIVPFAPGGGTDILGRLIGQKLSDRFGKSFVSRTAPAPAR